MSCFVYGIVFSRCRPRAAAPLTLPLGVGGAPVGLIEVGRLAAAVATVDSAALTPTLGSIMAHANVVEALHADRTVLPMRYGCVLDGKADVIRLLDARGDEYTKVLRGLEGCVEMGIRVLAGKAKRGTNGNAAVQNADFAPGAPSPAPGAAYLTQRKRVYADADRQAHEMARSVEWICGALDGRFLQRKTENVRTAIPSLSSVPFVSLYFLVRRESLDAFCRIVHRISRAGHGRFLPSGPWPPYNFAGCQ